jgi:diguanylate cyclase (GGDEF)-like protein
MKRINLLPTSYQNKLIIGVGLLLILIISVATASLFSIQSMNNAIHEIAYISSMDIGSIIRLRTFLFEVSTSVYRYLIYRNPEERELLAQLGLRIENAFDELMISSIASGQNESINSARQVWKQVRNTAEAILKTPDPEMTEATKQEMKQFGENVSVLFNHLGQLHQQVIQQTIEHQRKAQDIADRALFLIYVSFGLGTCIAIIVIIFLLRSILVPMRLLKQGASNFSKGELSYRIPVLSTDEFGELAKAFNNMAETLERSQAELEELAIHDGLTGLYNHREFQRRLQTEIERSQRYKHHFSLLMLDIDRFKKLNDTYGHQAGDSVLRALATQMRQEVRAVDYVARYGGEEFTIILPEMTASDAVTVAQRLRKNIAASAITISEGQTANITVSIGVATFPEDATSREKLIAAADSALYAAKAAGRNKVLRAV